MLWHVGREIISIRKAGHDMRMQGRAHGKGKRDCIVAIIIIRCTILLK